ncbi:MAG: hypothetical protein K2L07_05030 [Lachnospiraceae bacterium]|nr:hypothetical protein [Lachnospiraceae bacterium]
MTESTITNKNPQEMTISPNEALTDSDKIPPINRSVHRVGSITFGIILILLGILLLLRLIIPALTYTVILDFWPVTLIVLGLEVLIANMRSEQVTFQFDGWSVFFLFMILGFTICIGILDYILVHWPQNIVL